VSLLHWAMLVMGGAVAVWLVLTSRREKGEPEGPRVPVSRRDWAPPATESEAAGGVDEFGVGKARKRVPGDGPAPAPERKAPTIGTPAAAARPEKFIGLYIAEHEGTSILGPKIHAALQDQGLAFGDKKIYHRLDGGRKAFSVASLTKPGALDPAEAATFATPGLSVFLALPGPADPVAAFQDMLRTARELARRLNAELYDSEQRQPLTAQRERDLHSQVEDWARAHGTPRV
jgi:cell division protein ZipA